MNMNFNYEALAGRFSHNFAWSHQFVSSVDEGVNQVEFPGVPADRVVLSSNYSIDAWSIAYNINAIGSQCDDIGDDTDDNACVGHVPTWITHDLQLNYNTPWNSKISLGARNIGAKTPPIGLGNIGGRDYDFNLYDGFGRYTYLTFTQTF